MAPKPLPELGQDLKRSQAALREARAQLRRLTKLQASVDVLEDDAAQALVTQARVTVERLVHHLLREQLRLQRNVREAVRRRPTP